MNERHDPPNTIDLNRCDNQPFSVILCSKDEQGNDEWMHYSGILRWKDGNLFMIRSKEDPFEIRTEWHHRIRAVDDELRDILGNSQYLLVLNVGKFEDDAIPGHVKTNLKWLNDAG